MRPSPSELVLAWVDQADSEDIYLSSITVAEIEFGITILPVGTRKSKLEKSFQTILETFFINKVLSFDIHAAHLYARLLAYRRSVGRPMSQADCQIAAIAEMHSATLVTRNIRDFDGISANLLNPFG